jgi:hypothetical protein
MTTHTNGRRITTHEATVKTAAVAVKTLTISGKQVTLAVFRQLQKEDLIDEKSGDLRGVPWGTVNYFWGACEEGSHLHVVWQKDVELRRSCIPPLPVSPYWKETIAVLSEQYIHARFAEGWRPPREDLVRFAYPYKAAVEVMAADTRLVIPLDRFYCFDGHGRMTFDQKTIGTEIPPMATDEAWAVLLDGLSEREKFRQRWGGHYLALTALDQLFIAV